MVTTLILIAAVIWISGAILFVVQAQIAPLGIEDENGFRTVNLQPARVVENDPYTCSRPDGA